MWVRVDNDGDLVNLDRVEVILTATDIGTSSSDGDLMALVVQPGEDTRVIRLCDAGDADRAVELIMESLKRGDAVLDLADELALRRSPA